MFIVRLFYAVDAVLAATLYQATRTLVLLWRPGPDALADDIDWNTELFLHERWGKYEGAGNATSSEVSGNISSLVEIFPPSLPAAFAALHQRQLSTRIRIRGISNGTDIDFTFGVSRPRCGSRHAAESAKDIDAVEPDYLNDAHQWHLGRVPLSLVADFLDTGGLIIKKNCSLSAAGPSITAKQQLLKVDMDLMFSSNISASGIFHEMGKLKLDFFADKAGFVAHYLDFLFRFFFSSFLPLLTLLCFSGT